VSLNITPGLIVRIVPSNPAHLSAHARVERQSVATEMVYLTDEHGSDRVTFADELWPAIGFTGTIPPATPEHLRPKSAPLGFQDFSAKSKEMKAARDERKRKRLANTKTEKRHPGLTYGEVADLAGCTYNVVKKATISGRLERIKISHRECRIMPDVAETWAKQYRMMKGRA
jgi:hypothetical protein